MMGRVWRAYGFVALALVVGALAGCEATEPIVVDDGAQATSSVEPTETTAVPLDAIVLELETAAEGLDEPLYVTGDGLGNLVALEKVGQVWILSGGGRAASPFLDISDRTSTESEQGLLGIAFPHSYEAKGEFYVDYTGREGETVISRFTANEERNRADAATEEILLTFEQPYANHNGGMIEFGPDGLLYVGTGDGGAGGDPQGAGQRLDTMLGKILRIDVEYTAELHGVGGEDPPYISPPTNPALGAGSRPEIWAYGVRNPWRFSFDRETGDLWIGDVGQNEWEEIDFQPASSKGGENYGWAILEGTHPYPAGSDPGDTSGLVMPIVEYDRGAGKSVTGGYVYRGTESPALEGVYVYGDFVSGRIWGLRRGSAAVENVLFAETGRAISSFGEDDDGELYLVDFSGSVHHITARER
jgi:glucose/arabinose dehydrogenase